MTTTVPVILRRPGEFHTSTVLKFNCEYCIGGVTLASAYGPVVLCNIEVPEFT